MKPPLLMIHGGFCGGWYFDALGEYFATCGWTCHAPDLPYHDARAADGDPDPRLAACGIADYTAAMAEAIAGLESPPVVIGHSLGGLVAQQLAARGLARAAILLAPAAPWGIPPATSAEVEAVLGLMAAGPFWTTSLKPVFEVAAGNSIDRLPPDEQAAVFARFSAESGRALFETMFWPYDLTRASAVDETAVRCPLLCIAGGADKVISAATVERVARKYGAIADFVEFPGFGHWLIGEPGWQAIADHCQHWLADKLGA